MAQNKKAYADYEVIEKYTAGIELTGAEVKSIRASQTNLKGSYVEIKNGEAFTKKIHISPYKHASNQQTQYDPTRNRKLLLHKKEINKLETALSEKGISIIPLNFHISNNRIKLTIGICRGKKKYDRRNELKKRAQNIEIQRSLKHKN